MKLARRRKATYKTKSDAVRHGYITYGRYKSGARKFTLRKVKGGYRVYKKKKR